MKTLTPAERARRAAALGITLPASASRGATTSQCRPGPGGRAIAAQPVEPAPPPPKPAAGPRKLTGASYERFTRVRGLLQARYPQIFSWGRPLAIGIDQKLREAFTEEELPTSDLKVFLRTGCTGRLTVSPWRAVIIGSIDGSDAGGAFAETGGEWGNKGTGAGKGSLRSD